MKREKKSVDEMGNKKLSMKWEKKVVDETASLRKCRGNGNIPYIKSDEYHQTPLVFTFSTSR
jgi:hypothetical protein